MTKYIVKNCPCYEWGSCRYEYVEHECCSKNDDCPIKQVVELCMNYPEKPDNSLSNRILRTLQVEDME